MNRLAAFMFWGFFGSVALLGAGIYASGRAPHAPKTCTSNGNAMAAAEAFHDSIGGGSGRRTGQIFQRGDRAISVTLIFGSAAAVYSVFPDCTVKFG